MADASCVSAIPSALPGKASSTSLSWEEPVSRTVQFTLAIIALVFVLPLMIAIAIAVYAQDRGPIIFAHKRIGRNGRHFYCYKFRSMCRDAERRLTELLARDDEARREWEETHKLRYDPRVTALGDFLRKTSLDELPQLFNVMRGEMNLVGPRPIVDAEVVKYGRRFQHYCAVKPGITGLWQVSGRSDLTYRQRVAMDCLYTQKRGLGLDVWIMAATVPAVMLRQGSC